MNAFKGPTCRGIFALGTPCGMCERCAADPMQRLPLVSIGTPMPAIKTREDPPFITCESGGGEYVVRIKCGTLKQAHSIHEFLIDALGTVKP